MQPIRFATIGTSHIAEVFMDAASQLPDDVEYVACYSRTMEKAREFGEAHGARLFFDDLDALAACDEVDAVYIATPNTLHREQAIRMLRAGKHVLLEKPFCPTLAEAREVFEAAHASGALVMEAMRSIHDPGFAATRDAIGKIGPVRQATIRFSKFSGRWGLLQSGQTPSCFDPRRAGGSLTDIGIYTVEFMVALFGMPEAVSAMGVMHEVPAYPADSPYHLTDVSGQALLKYDGMVGNLVWGKVSDNHIPSEIQGERGTVLVTTESDPREVTLVVPKPITGAWGTGEGVAHKIDVPDVPNNIRSELEDFVRCIRGQEPLVLGVDQAEHVTLQSLEVMDEIRSQLGVVFE
ncbi:Gfo/Idh/MocA family protein [Atopobiaceae bacterium SGI.236]